MRYSWLFRILIGIGIVFFLSQNVPAETGIAQKEPVVEKVAGPEQQWGITIKSVRITAAGHMVDFRYRVIDPDKATMLLRKQSKAYMVDQKTGTQLSVPRTRIGPLRQTTVKPMPNRDYAMLFTNPMGLVKKGDKVTVVVGDFKAENLTVE
jgi:hypothetical protein